MADKDTALVEDDEKKADAKADEYVIVEDKPTEAAERDKGADEDDDDERLADDPNETDAEREERKSNRDEKRARAARRRAAMERDKQELAALRDQNQMLFQRLSALEGRSIQQDRATIDQRLQEASYEAQTAEPLLAKAVEAGNGEDVAKALRVRDDARDRARQLQAYKQRAEAAMRQPAPQPQAPKVDPLVASFATDWMKSKEWYDPQGKDEDSAIVLAIDQRLAEEGFDPKSADYWRELDKRLARRLPHRYEPQQRSEGRRGPPVGSGREHAPQSTRKEVYISPERKQALMDAGVWDDPQARARYIKAFAEYDRANRR